MKNDIDCIAPIRYDTKKGNKIIHNPDKHYPNKHESEVLRRLKMETNLTEEEIRSIKKYRKILSEASKEGQKPKRTKIEKYYQNLIKKACKETKLAKEHPLTIKVLDELLKVKTIRRPWYISLSNIPSAKRIIEYYGKKKNKGKVS